MNKLKLVIYLTIAVFIISSFLIAYYGNVGLLLGIYLFTAACNIERKLNP